MGGKRQIKKEKHNIILSFMVYEKHEVEINASVYDFHRSLSVYLYR